LVIDNRASTFDISDYHIAGNRFDELSNDNKFRDIWFYTGFYSDDDGSNAEWSVCPILLSEETNRKMEHIQSKADITPDEDGIVYSSVGND